MKTKVLTRCALLLVLLSPACRQQAGSELPANQWIQLRNDAVGARRASAVRYVPDVDRFFLWGFMDFDPDLLQEHPLAEVPEYDVVTFDLNEARWRNHFPEAWEKEWSRTIV